MQTLQRIKYVDHIVERIFFEVALLHFSSECNEWFEVHVPKLEQIVELENLVDQELQAGLIQDLVEVERIKRRHIDPVQRHLQVLYLHVNQVHHHQKLMVDLRIH